MKMVDIEKAVIARLKTHGQDFEILVDCDNALKLKSGEDVSFNDILAAEQVFSDAKKGLAASETRMQTIFETTDIKEIAKKIIQKGEIQVTAEHRSKLRDQKMRKVLDLINMNGIDPRTKLPHPRNRIELAFEEAKIRVDDSRSAEDQIERIIKELRPILPIKFEKKKIAVKIPALHAGKGYSVLQNFGNIVQEDWQSDGSYACVLHIPAGLQNELIDRVNKLTHGDVEVKILGEE